MEPSATTKSPVENNHTIRTSILLQHLLTEAPPDYFTFDWLVGHLPKRSFGVILLFLALISILPVISFPARLLIIMLVGQILLGYPAPVLPLKWMKRRFPSRYLKKLHRYAVPALEHIEIMVKPRWPSLLMRARRFTAFVALLLTFLSLITPLPLSNVPPAIISVLVALAYTEHDGVLLTFALILALTLLAVVFLAIFGIYKI